MPPDAPPQIRRKKMRMDQVFFRGVSPHKPDQEPEIQAPFFL